jgi:hypothetical protein
LCKLALATHIGQATPINRVMVERADKDLMLDFSPFESTQTTLANVFAATFLPPEVRGTGKRYSA